MSAFINEFHYDNIGADVGEFIEIAAPSGFDLSNWSIVLYNGSTGAAYRTIDLTGLSLTGAVNGFGFLSVAAPGLQNGSPDGIALVNSAGSVVEFLSYEGTLAAVDGPAAGLTSTDVGVSETGTTDLGKSLQRQGDGTSLEFAGPLDQTPGALNEGQVLDSGVASIPMLVINEILADPASDLAGDANGDGTRDATDDEFIEIVNTGDAEADLSGLTLSDAIGIRHTFADETTLAAGAAIVVFGGGTPSGDFAGAEVVVASSGTLGLNNSGDTVTVVAADGTVIAQVDYGSEAGQDQSITRDPDLSGDFVQHAGATGSGGALYSPGARIDGTPHMPSVPGFVINEIDADQTGTDSAEFIEIFDGGLGNVSLDGLVVVLFNGNGDAAYDAIDLTGQSTDENGYFVIGSEDVANVDLVAFSSNGLQNGADAVALYQGSASDFPTGTPATSENLIDAIVYGTSDAEDTALLEALGQDTQFDENQNAAKDTQSLARVPDGTGTFVAQSPTPGAANEVFEPEIVRISEVQGATGMSPLVGSTVTIEAIVVGDFQNDDGDPLRDLGGFFLQEEDADHDADAETSEGIFVFDRGLALGADVALGDKVLVTGTVSEFFGQTQISATSVSIVEPGAVADVNEMAVSVSLDAVDDVIVDAEGKYAPDLEAYEGMLATFTDNLVVNEMFQLDRFNEIRVSVDARPEQYTQLFEPDTAGFDAYQRQTGADQIIFDDGLNAQNAPILAEADLNGDGVFDTADGFSMGDTIAGLTGVINYSWAGNAASDTTWRVRSIDDGNVFEDTSAPDVTPPDVGGTLTVASFNVLNYFTTLDVDGNPGSGPNALDPRGADNQLEFDRQTEKLVTAMQAMDADIFGLVELENEFGTDQNGDGLVAINFLVDALNARIGEVTYAAVDPGRSFVDVGDAISVGMIYKIDSVSVVEGSVEILNDEDLADLPSDYTGSVFDGTSTNRAPLAATFQDLSTGEDFTVAVTHMKSKGGNGTGPDADLGDGAGNFNDIRVQGVQALNEWLAGFADEDQLVLGDFNAYLMEDPIDQMLSDGYTNLEEVFQPGKSSFVFDGKTGTLDYAFGSDAIMDNVTGAAVWQINSDQPDALDYNTDFGRDAGIFDETSPLRSSDHDPILVGLEFEAPVNIVQGSGRFFEKLKGTSGADQILTGGGRFDLLFGFGGEDEFVIEQRENGRREVATIADYETGIDTVDLNGRHVAHDFSFGHTTVLLLAGDYDAVVVRGASDIDEIDFDIAFV